LKLHWRFSFSNCTFPKAHQLGNGKSKYKQSKALDTERERRRGRASVMMWGWYGGIF
jgi:hypothetical protein